jgi:formyltetrahydrofolate synthetase
LQRSLGIVNTLLFSARALTLASDIEIAQAQIPKPVADLAAELGLRPDELESYGKYKAKVELSVLERLAHRKDGKYIVISGSVVCQY